MDWRIERRIIAAIVVALALTVWGVLSSSPDVLRWAFVPVGYGIYLRRRYG